MPEGNLRKAFAEETSLGIRPRGGEAFAETFPVRMEGHPYRNSKISAPGMANNMVRLHLLNTPASACEIGTSPVPENISKAMIRPNIC